MGDAKDPFALILEAVAMSELPLKQFYPTHCNRNKWIFEASKKFGKEGWIDLTTSSYRHYPDDEIKPSRAIRELLQAGVPPAHISMTSDAHGSLPGFDRDGNLTGLEMGMPFSMLQEVRDAVNEGLPLPTALATITSNPSRILKLASKGSLAAGKEADMILVNREFEIQTVIAMGKVLMEKGEILVDFHYE
jgi:beta-aspartyl-dipeptidase (metallo-type)